MLKSLGRMLPACFLGTVAMVSPAHAQWAVVDVGAITQLIQEVSVLRQQLLTAESQLQQAKTELASMSGSRGMQFLLSGTSRNYLPTSASQLTLAIQGNGSYPTLSADVRTAVNANAVMAPAQLAALSTVDQQQLISQRQAVALRQALAQEALANSSARFSAIQSLIASISSATDQKGILDLQARITAELGMLQNEQTKLQVLSRASDALASVNAERALEQAVIEQGRFQTRFQPAP